MRAQGPYSSKLLEYVQTHGQDYSAFLFLPYLYATTYFVLPLVAKKAILIPLLHDEWMLQLSMWDEVFERACASVFLTKEERSVAVRRFGARLSNAPIIGSGVDWMQGDAQRFRRRFNLPDPFMLYLGRIDDSKGCGDLISLFLALPEPREFDKLVLAGPGSTGKSGNANVLFTGELDEQTKWDALAACDLFVMPSRYESLSIALLEAWRSEKPALVNGFSRVLMDHCKSGNGGLWYRNAAEFNLAVRTLTAPTRSIIGKQGASYVREQFDWASTVATLIPVIERVAAV